MITIFSIPKPFVDAHIKRIQNNAIASWRALSKEVEIILCGDEEGVYEAAVKQGALHLRHIKKNAHGTPLINDAFHQVRKMAQNSILCYTNADIIHTPSLLKTIKKVRRLPQYLMVGRRIDIDVREDFNFSRKSGFRAVQFLVEQTGLLHGYSGIDYLVFPKEMEIPLLPFAVGRPGWDNWCIYDMRIRGVPVIDASALVAAIHQNHAYRHNKQGKRGIWRGEEAQENFRLAGGLGKLMSIKGASIVLTKKGFQKPGFDRRLYVWLTLFPLTQKILELKRLLQNKYLN